MAAKAVLFSNKISGQSNAQESPNIILGIAIKAPTINPIFAAASVFNAYINANMHANIMESMVMNA
jgi:hypothetical protein